MRAPDDAGDRLLRRFAGRRVPWFALAWLPVLLLAPLTAAAVTGGGRASRCSVHPC